jgi:hypothetical protein
MVLTPVKTEGHGKELKNVTGSKTSVNFFLWNMKSTSLFSFLCVWKMVVFQPVRHGRNDNWAYQLIGRTISRYVGPLTGSSAQTISFLLFETFFLCSLHHS